MAQLPGQNPRPGKKVLVRADGAGGTKAALHQLAHPASGRLLGRFTLPLDTTALYKQVPEWVWSPALNADEGVREGADVVEFTGLLNLEGWPKDMRVIVRRERPHPEPNSASMTSECASLKWPHFGG